MALKKRLIKWLLIKYIKDKVRDLRGKDSMTTFGKILKFLDGWKLVVAVLLIAGARVWDMANNGHAGDAIGILLAIVGYTPGADWSILARDLGTHLLAVLAIGHKLAKARAQSTAGAPAKDLLSENGYIIKAFDDASKK